MVFLSRSVVFLCHLALHQSIMMHLAWFHFISFFPFAILVTFFLTFRLTKCVFSFWSNIIFSNFSDNFFIYSLCCTECVSQNYISVLEIFASPFCITWTHTGCETGWFGPLCQYKCRCTPQCQTDGSCRPGSLCQTGWFGPACQYGKDDTYSLQLIC